MGGETGRAIGRVEVSRYVTVACCSRVRPHLEELPPAVSAADVLLPSRAAPSRPAVVGDRTHSPRRLYNVPCPRMASGRVYGPALVSTRFIIPPAASLAADGLSALYSLGPQRRSAS